MIDINLNYLTQRTMQKIFNLGIFLKITKFITCQQLQIDIKKNN